MSGIYLGKTVKRSRSYCATNRAQKLLICLLHNYLTDGDLEQSAYMECTQKVFFLIHRSENHIPFSLKPLYLEYP